MGKKCIIFGGIIIVGILLWTVVFRGSKNVSPDTGKITIVTSFYPLFFFAHEIAGDKANVINITPAGAEPHDYEPTPQDIVHIEQSDVLVMNGDGLEAWGESIKQNIDPKRTTVVVAGQGLATQQISEGGETMIDPHVWQSPVLAQKMADAIAQAIEHTDPKNGAYYQSNAEALKVTLQNLDETYRQGLAQCAKKDIITSHAAFGYLAAAYGLTQISIAGLSPDAEPSSKQLGDIATFAQAHGVKYIFFESLASPKLSQTIATEIGAQTLVLNPIEGLMSDDIVAGKNYVTEMESNLRNLQMALGCTI